MQIPKSYKPEISVCPLCGSKLKYRYTVSDKVIQFSHGEYIRIKNLGYSCKNQECPHPEFIYTSQTAAKLCVKGYTYSAKVIARIIYLKHLHKSREEIANILADDGIDISDRNIDIMYEKLEPLLEMDYKKNIEVEYNYMNKECGGVYLSIDSITLEDNYRFFSIRNFFTSHQIGWHLIDCSKDNPYAFLDDYLSPNKNIKLIVTIRPIFEVFREIEMRVGPDTKFEQFIKF